MPPLSNRLRAIDSLANTRLPGDLGGSPAGRPRSGSSAGAGYRDPTFAIRDLLGERFLPEFERLAERQAELEEQLLGRIEDPIDFESFRGELSTLAESVTRDLFGPGGAVEDATTRAAGESVRSGFGTRSGGFDRARLNILEGARDQVTDVVGRAAPQLAQTAAQTRAADIGALGEFTAGQAARQTDLLESLFGGFATIEQINQAREQLGLNEDIIREVLRGGGGGGVGGFLGKLGGGLLGATLGPIAGGIGGALGEQAGDYISGLFS